MKEVTNYFGKRKSLRSAVMAAGALMLVLAVAAVAVADLVVTGSITGNTVNYTVTGADPDSDYNVTIQHDGTGQSNTYGEHSNGDGEFSGSGTPGNSSIEPGDSVNVNVYDEDGNQVGGITISKKSGVPWWAYTGLGTFIYILV